MKRRWFGILGIVILLAAGYAFWKWDSRPMLAPYHIQVVSGEEISLWDFQGAYIGNAELEAKADASIGRSLGLIGSGQYSDYTLYVSVANQYDLKGDGRNELMYLEKALAVSTTTGLAWHNAGQLFTRLGAYQTARFALERAAAVQPITQYERALVDFLEAHFPEDTAAIGEGRQALENIIGEVSQ